VGVRPPGDITATVRSGAGGAWRWERSRQAIENEHKRYGVASARRRGSFRQAVVVEFEVILRCLAPSGTCPPPGGLEAVAPSSTCPPLGDLVVVSPKLLDLVGW